MTSLFLWQLLVLLLLMLLIIWYKGLADALLPLSCIMQHVLLPAAAQGMKQQSTSLQPASVFAELRVQLCLQRDMLDIQLPADAQDVSWHVLRFCLEHRLVCSLWHADRVLLTGF